MCDPGIISSERKDYTHFKLVAPCGEVLFEKKLDVAMTSFKEKEDIESAMGTLSKALGFGRKGFKLTISTGKWLKYDCFDQSTNTYEGQ